MIEMNDIITKTYYIRQNFYVDIVKNLTSNLYESWIWNDNYGIKNHIFSIPLETTNDKEYLKLVENNLFDYVTSYVDDYFDSTERKEFYAKNNNTQNNRS